MQIRATRLTAIASTIRRMFSPASLFANGEQGAWYDPSDMSTLFQDAAGTTPVTAVEQFVGLMMDKSKGLVLGPELYSGGEITLQPATEVSIGTTVVGKCYRVNVPVGLQGNFGPGWNTTSTGTGIHYRISDGIGFRLRNFGATAVTFTATLRELPGNHASQPTSTARPRLSARVNLTLASEVFVASSEPDNSVLLNNQGLISPRGDLTASKVSFASNGRRYRQDFITNPSGQAFKHSVWLRSDTPTVVGLRVASLAVAEDAFISCNVSNVWQQFTVSRAFAISGTAVRFGLDNRLGFGGGGVACEIEVWGADLRVANTGVNLPPYQRVNTSTDYDTVGYPRYLVFDGVDDFMSTGNINFTGTDKMTVWAGFLSNPASNATAVVVELGNTLPVGGFVLHDSYNVGNTSFGLNQSAVSVYGFGPRLVGVPNIITGELDYGALAATDEIKMRRNGVQMALSGQGGFWGPSGTGNYGNHPMFIGSRAGTSLRFNGNLYQLIIRGAATNAAQLANTDAWVNTRTGAY